MSAERAYVLKDYKETVETDEVAMKLLQKLILYNHVMENYLAGGRESRLLTLFQEAAQISAFQP